MKPKILDLFCGAGGAAMVLHRAGLEPYGIDNKPQPRYPYPFLCMDAIEAMGVLLDGGGLTFSNGETLYLADFAAYWGSPPCQHYSWAAARWRNSGNEYPDLIEVTRDGLLSTGKPYVIENVVGAKRRLRHPIVLCGQTFGLRLIRHRCFEVQPFILSPGHRKCQGAVSRGDALTVAGHGGDSVTYRLEDVQEAMGIDWMVMDELTQAIPPAYSEYIARQMMQVRGIASPIIDKGYTIR